MTKHTDCHAVTTGEGYWTCDVPGGCQGCRFLARDAEDDYVLAEWYAERKAVQVR